MSGNPWSWRRRQRLALLINASMAGGAFVVAALNSKVEDWRPASLVAVLAAFAVASELLPIKLPRGFKLKSGAHTVTSSAPYVLAVVLLGAAPALAMGIVALSVVAFAERTPWRDIVSNFANYGAHLVPGALLADLAVATWGLSPADPALVLVVIGVYAYSALVGSFIAYAAYDALAYGASLRDLTRNEWRVLVAVELPIMVATALTAHIYATAGVASLAVLVVLQLIFVSLARQLDRSYERAAALKERGDELAGLHANLERDAQRIANLSASRGRLVGQVLTAEEGERRRLAEALHDDAMQNLLAARQELGGGLGASEIWRARAAIDKTIDQLREAIFELHPAVLDQVGLAAGLEAVAERTSRRGGFAVTINVRSRKYASREVLLFTISRELLANAAEHALASRVTVDVRDHPGGVLLQVTDDGRGFDPERLGAALDEGHIGLALIRERIEALGGTFDLNSRIGHGATVTATIPIDPDAATEDSPDASAPIVRSGRAAPLSELAL